jgi:hypothetical protein
MIFASEVKLICGWFDVEIGICLIGLSMNVFALIWSESETLFSNRARSFYLPSTTHCVSQFTYAALSFRHA